MKVYIDSNFHCSASDDGTGRAVETDFFDGKCAAFIQGYQYIPAGESWTREDGEVFTGEMIAPWMPYSELSAAQAQYEAMLPQIRDMETALQTLGVSVDG